jgi:AmmeMemoRadiSam system protein A
LTKEREEKYLSKDEERTLLKLARETLKGHLSEGRAPSPAQGGYELTEKLKADGAAFVTLMMHGHLRGCIGHVVGFEPLYSSVIHNTMSAATEDPRFEPMTAREEPEVHIGISVMSPLRAITDVSEIRVGTHGIMITQGLRRGLLLPQVASEYGWDREEFLEHTCEKAGLPGDAWKQGATIQIFSAQVFGEE